MAFPKQPTETTPENVASIGMLSSELVEYDARTFDTITMDTRPHRANAGTEVQVGQYGYPFKASLLRKNIEQNPDQFTVHIAQGFDLQRSIAELNKPVVEVAGPTSAGFYFLDGVNLPYKPYITNISFTPPGEARKHRKLVDEAVDARHLLFGDDSVGLMLMSCIPKRSDPQDASTKGLRLKKKIAPQDTELISKADQEMREYAAGQLSLDGLQFSLRARIYAEASRVVAEGGLLTINLPTDMDIVVLKKLGFNLVAALENDEHRSELVLSGTYIPCFESAVLQKDTTQPEDRS